MLFSSVCSALLSSLYWWFWILPSCCCSVTKSCLTLCNPVDCSTPNLPVLHYFLEFAQTQVHWVSDTIQLSHLLSSPSPPAFNLSQHQGLLNESVLSIRWPKYWSFSISPSNEYSGLISFRMDWFDLLAVQGTLKSLLQHHSSKGSILQCSAFFIVQLSHPYMTTGKTIVLTRRTFVGKVMSLLFNMLSRPKQIIELENEVDYNWLRSSSLLWQYHGLSGLNSKHLFLMVLDWKLEIQNQNADTVRFLVNTFLLVNTCCILT